MQTIVDGGSLGMDRVRIMCSDNGGDLFMGDFQWETEAENGFGLIYISRVDGWAAAALFVCITKDSSHRAVQENKLNAK